MDEGRSVTDRTRTATEQYAAEIVKLNELLTAGAIDQATYAKAVEDANDQLLRSSQEWTDGATRFLKDYVAESQDAATATERAFANAFGGAEDALVGFATTGRLELRSLADSVLADISRMAVRQTITAPIAGLLQGGLAGGGLFGLFHEGGVVSERPPALCYADPGIFEHAPRYHGGGFAGSGLLPDDVPIIARRGELVVPPERIVRVPLGILAVAKLVPAEVLAELREEAARRLVARPRSWAGAVVIILAWLVLLAIAVRWFVSCFPFRPEP